MQFAQFQKFSVNPNFAVMFTSFKQTFRGKKTNILNCSISLLDGCFILCALYYCSFITENKLNQICTRGHITALNVLVTTTDALEHVYTPIPLQGE